MGSIYSTDKTSHSCNSRHSFTCPHTSRNTASMNNKFRTTRKARSLFTLCCFVFSGCATTSNPTTRATLNLSSSTIQATTTTTTQPVQPVSLPPSTTLQTSGPEAQPFDLVAQQFDEFVEWRKNCNFKPKDCAIDEFTIAGTPFNTNFAKVMRDYAKHNIHSRPDDGERKIKVETISQDETTMTAIVHGCVYDTVVLYMGGGIYDDKVASSISSWTMQWHNERWYWTNYEIHKKIYNTNFCDS